MPTWMRKITVVLVTIITLGVYVPIGLLETDASEREDKNDSSISALADKEADAAISSDTHDNEIDKLTSKDYVVHDLTEQAKSQTLTKFGPRIADQVEADFSASILPQMEMAFANLIEEADGTAHSYYEITENPTRGYGERIFHVYDGRTNEYIARFDVRRENRPQEGYYFHFHYHLSNDNFKRHYPIGEVYWDKNTPPKWMA